MHKHSDCIVYLAWVFATRSLQLHDFSRAPRMWGVTSEEQKVDMPRLGLKHGWNPTTQLQVDRLLGRAIRCLVSCTDTGFKDLQGL